MSDSGQLSNKTLLSQRIEDFAIILTSIQLAGVAPEVNLRNSVQTRKHVSEKSTLTLKPRAYATRSLKQWYQWPPEKV